MKNAHVGIALWNTQNDRFLLQHNSNKYFVPASNVKILTLYASLKYLPDSIPSFNYYNTPDTVFIMPKGDPTFLHPDFQTQRSFDFLKQLQKPVVILPVQWETDIFGKGWAWDDYLSPYMPKRSPFPVCENHIKDSVSKQLDFPSVTDIYLNATHRLSDTLGVPVILSAVGRNLNEQPITFYSASRDSICRKMMFESDNFMAEQLLLMVSEKLLGSMNEAKLIEKLLSDTLFQFPQKPVWVDGSGLSRYNLFTPEDMIHILQKLESEFGRKRIETIFPTGNQGTLKGYYDDKTGYIFAKTGTLSGQISLSGYLTTKKNTPLIFSIMVNNHTGKASEVRKLMAEYIDRVWRSY